MRLSQQKSLLFKSSISPKKTLKQPKQLITKLNTEIETIQHSIMQYNEIQKRSINWRKEMNFSQHTTQLKALSQPKLQNILLQSNFINNMAIFGKNMNESSVKKSNIKPKDAKNTNFMMNSSSSRFRKTMSMKVDGSYKNKRKNDENGMRNSQKSINRSRFQKDQAEENPEIFTIDIHPQFHSFREGNSQNRSGKKFDAKANINKKLNKGQVSQLSSMVKTLQKCPSKNMHSDSTIFDENQFKDNETIIDDEAQSIMMQTSTRLFNQEFTGDNRSKNNFSKELGLIPISQEKMITLSNQRNTKTVRQQIQEKTIRLQKQWLLTEFFREKFNIMPNTTKDQSRVTQNKPKRSVNKLANIIQKVEERRPTTSISYQRTQNSRQTTITEDLVKQKSRTHTKPDHNESTHLNISTFGFDIL